MSTAERSKHPSANRISIVRKNNNPEPSPFNLCGVRLYLRLCTTMNQIRSTFDFSPKFKFFFAFCRLPVNNTFFDFHPPSRSFFLLLLPPAVEVVQVVHNIALRWLRKKKN